MIRTEFIHAQMERLSCLDRFPKGGPAKQAIIQAFVETFHDERKMLKFIGDWLREYPTCPKPMHIYSAKERLDHITGSSCTDCYGTGEVSAWHLVTYGPNGRKQSVERLTPEQYRELGPKLDKGKRRIYELPVPCGCRARRTA